MNLSQIRGMIVSALEDDPELAPLLIRFAWHCCGTYDAEKGNGGSNGGTMRTDTERSDKENSGFDKAFHLFESLQNHKVIIFHFLNL